MNYLYLNNPTRPVAFNKRNEKIDWRRIAAVDVDRVAREMDFQILQDNIEQIALCNIDIEVDSRAMDPNFVKLYKMAQLIIEYLLLCQDQITNQLVDYEQIKNKNFLEQDEFHRQLDKLKNDLNITKKESKKRKKLIETQQKMLMAQHSNHHTCPVCSHSFLSVEYLQAHMNRRHPEYNPNRKHEHDVDIEKEMQRLKDQLHSKETELQLVKVQKTVDGEKIRDRDETIRQLKDEIQSLTTKITILDEKYFSLRSSTQTGSPSPHRREPGLKELLKENKNIRADNEQLKQLLQQAESNLKKEEKLKRRFQRENENLRRDINDLNENLRLLQNTSGDSNRLLEELITSRNKYNEEKVRRKKLQDELDAANEQLARFRNQPPPIVDRKSPTPHPRSSASPPPPIIPASTQHRPRQTTEIFLPQYCPSLVRQINENPRFMNNYRDTAKRLYIEELEQNDYLAIRESETRLNTADYEAKMKSVLDTRQNMQRDLPNFERIRADLSRTLDQLVQERMNIPRESVTSMRSSSGKLVTFQDESQHHRHTIPPKTTVQSKTKYDHSHPRTNYRSDEDDITHTISNDSDDYDKNILPTRPEITTDIQPSPRKQVPASSTSALVTGGIRPSPTTGTKTVSMLVTPESAIKKHKSDSDSDSPIPPRLTNNASSSNVASKTYKLNEINTPGQKPGVTATTQGFQPSRQTLVSDNVHDDKSDSSLTSIDDRSPQRKISTGYHPKNSGREPAINHHHLSSGDASQYTYDSLYKSPAAKGTDFRRPQTADSAKTSNMDSDDNLDEVSN